MASEEFNPYAAPGSTVGRDVPSEYYRLDYRRMSYRELWRITPSCTLFTFMATSKALHLPLRIISPTLYPRVRALDFVEPGQVPSEVWAKWRDAFVSLNEAGYTLNFVIRQPASDPEELNFSACCHADDDMTLGGCTYYRPSEFPPEKAVATYTLTSLLADGREATSHTHLHQNGGSNLAVTNQLTGASMAELLESHQGWLATFRVPTVPLDRATDADRALKNWTKQFDQNVQRKLYVPVPASEYASLRRRIESAPPRTQVQLNPSDRKFSLALIVLTPILLILWLLGYL
jgi:hypothetical protein